jgi:hypothetical protein
MLAQLGASAALAQAPGLLTPAQPGVPGIIPLPQPTVPGTTEEIFNRLRPGHPRLLVLDADIDRVRQNLKESALARRIYSDLSKECDRLLSIPPVEYKVAGGRLQTTAMRALDRIATLSLMYRLDGRDPWLRRAVMEMNAVAGFRDWNPARFLDTAIVATAFALGYDWLYAALAPEERAVIRDALIVKAIDQAMPIYQRKTWWATEHFNWNIVCNSAMTMAALSVAEESSEKAGDILRAALESIPRGIATWGADGAWPEGSYYGEQAMRYTALFLASLDTALSTDFGLGQFHGVDRAGRFRAYTAGPTHRLFNFGDGPEETAPAPEMFWMARRYNMPAYAWFEQKLLERSRNPDALDLAWFERDAKPPQGPMWGLDAQFPSAGIAVMRTAWDDPAAICLALKGGDNKAPHAHLDLGSFALDAGGVRWTADLSGDDVPSTAPQRAGIYRIRTESHNTLTIDGENQDPRGEARVNHMESTPDLSWAQVDLSKACAKVKQWTRRVGIAQKQAVIIEDSLRSDQPVEVIWGMMTDADVSVNGATATLKRGVWNLALEIRSPRHAVFDVAPPHAPVGQTVNPKVQRLVARLVEKVEELDLQIILTPFKDGQQKPKITAQFPA